jgi:hypothetical protein
MSYNFVTPASLEPARFRRRSTKVSTYIFPYHHNLVTNSTDLLSTDIMAMKSPKMVSHGSIMGLLVAKKGTQIVHVFRRAGIKNHREVLYKKYIKPAPPVLTMVKAFREQDGFTGYIGLCEGHKALPETFKSTEPTVLPYKHNCAPELTRWFFQTVKPNWTKEDLFKDLLSCPDIVALQLHQAGVQCNKISNDTETIAYDMDMVRNICDTIENNFLCLIPH